MDGINKEVKLIENVLNPIDFERICMYFKNHQGLASVNTDEFGRKLAGDKSEPILKEFSEILLPKVRNYFGSQTMLSSYSLFSEYSADTINLHRHKDANACTYTLDLVLYQNNPWALFVDGKSYSAKPNEAIMFMGEEYEHWRETLYNNTDKIGVVFFHYVEPDHWWFIEGPEYIKEILKTKRVEKQ